MSAEHSTVEFRPIPGFPGYRVSNTGIVQSCYRWGSQHRSDLTGEWRTLKGNPGHHGHLRVRLYRDGEIHHFFVHQLVMLAFVGPCPPGMECRHLDGNPRNNRLDNLAWGTKKENGEDRVRHGNSPQGSKHHKAKLTEAVIPEIRRRHKSGETMRSLARAFGVNPSTIGRAVNGKLWIHV